MLKINHFYQYIHGWFTFPELYKQVVEEFNNAIFVEVGSWKGKSAAFMAVEIANSNKDIKFYCIDPWAGGHPAWAGQTDNNKLYERFLSNIEPVKSYINPIRDYSVNAAKQFQDNSIDFVFIDACHDYKNVKADIEAWYPKVKPGGILAGHDYYTWQTDVNRAVDQFAKKLNLTVNSQENCWKIII